MLSTGASDAALADALAAERSSIVAEALDVLFARNPEWKTRWGLHGKEMTERDTAYHVEFLEAALRAGDARVFATYSSWLAGILRARRVPVDALAESYDVLRDVIAGRLGAGTKLAELLAAGKRALDEPPRVPGVRAGAPHPAVPILVEAMLKSDRRAVDRILRDVLASGVDGARLGDALVQPAMTEIGRLWQQNEITVAQEHLATAIVQSSLARAFAESPPPAPGERRAVFACVEGNHHALGLRIVADGYELAGWDVRFLGADVPTRDLVTQVAAWKPELLALSLSLPQHVATARRTIATLRERLGAEAPRVIVGGLPLNEFEGLGDVVGADRWYPSASAALGDRG